MTHRPAYLIAGTDWPKVDAAAARLRSQFDEDSVVQITLGDEESEDVVSACLSLGLFGGERLVLVRGVESLSDDDAAAIAGYLADPTPDTCLALFGAGGVNPKGVLAKAVEKVGDVRFFEAPDKKQAVEWVAKRFSEWGVKPAASVAKRIVERVGEDTGDLALEVEKVALHAHPDPPTMEDVDLLVISQPDVKPWDVTDAWGRRDAAAVIELATADIERPEDVHRTIGQITAHVRRVRQAAVMLEAGHGQAEVQKALNLKSFPAKKLCEQSRGFSEPELAAAIVRLAQLDLAVKGSSRLDARFELELALAEISAR
jgi:DNA polymerase-3 subunit delta